MINAGYFAVRETLQQRLREPAPARIQLLVGPRQVGKTRLLLELAREYGGNALYCAADAPEVTMPEWWDYQRRHIFRLAREHTAVMLLDEIQYLPDWSRLLKSHIDQIYRENLPIHIVVSGSAALHLGAGARESMAGRFERLELAHWPARDLSQAFAMSREDAIETSVRFGNFPGAVRYLDDYERWRIYILESIIEPAIGRDLLVLEAIRKPALLRQVYAICAGHPCEVVSLTKIAGLLNEQGDVKTIAHYLQLLHEAFLVHPANRYARNELRRRAAPPKLIPLSNAFLAAMTLYGPPQPQTDAAQWGRWVENACIAFALSCRQQVQYWREEPLEVDAVLDGSWGRWALEVKTGAFSPRQELRGLFEFTRRNPEYHPLVLCDDAMLPGIRAAGIDGLSWRDFLWDGVNNLV